MFRGVGQALFHVSSHNQSKEEIYVRLETEKRTREGLDGDMSLADRFELLGITDDADE
jgi:hypothetical protein